MPEEQPARGPAVEITYNIWLPDDTRMEFLVRLDRESLALVNDARPGYPPWTALSFHQCPNCKLEPVRSPQCPVAINIVDIVEFFREVPSYEEVDVSVVCTERKFVKRTSVQFVVGSLMGLYMVTSGCPVLDRFRPFAGSHLPFVTFEEYSFRVFSMYMAEQYVKYKNGGAPDWDLRGLAGLLTEAETVNASFCKRLSSIRSEGGDTCLNAVNNLNSMCVLARMSIEDEPPEIWASFMKGEPARTGLIEP